MTDRSAQPLASSYRDPSGFVFIKEGVLYRQVNAVFQYDFEHFINSGCFAHLVKHNWLVAHKEIDENLTQTKEWHKTLLPEKIPFISYPNEWSFDMLKDAALLTLKLLKESLPFGIILKDATPFNIQWINASPIFIDTLSFEKYDSSKPWIAYRQFCENFLSPLLLMKYTGQPMQALLLAYPEGIPLQLTRSLLPLKSKFSLHCYLHIHLHAGVSARQADKQTERETIFTEKKLQRLVSSLETLIESLQWRGQTTTWEKYYEEAAKRGNYIDTKKSIINCWLDEQPQLKTAADIGGNDGEFSMLLVKHNIQTITTDFDHSAVNNLYKKIKKENISTVLPLLIDVSNPTPSIGVNNKERDSFIQRAKVDIAFALALIHHLCVGKNIPLNKTAAFFSSICNYLLIEYVPKTDEKVQLMLSQKKDIYTDYTEDNFVNAFEKEFKILKKQTVGTSGRTLYLMKKNA